MAADAITPWLCLEHGKGSSRLKEFRQVLTSIKLPANSSPCPTLLVGRASKSEVLRHYLNGTDQNLLANSHNQVLLWKEPQRSSDMIYFDFELQAYENPRVSGDSVHGSPIVRVAEWFGSVRGPFTRRGVANLICGRAISPLCHSVCFFAADLGGIRGVASLLAGLINESPASDLPLDCLPQALVVVETSSSTFDCQVVEQALIEALCDVSDLGDDHDQGQIRSKIALHFTQIRVLGVQTSMNGAQRARIIRRRLLAMKREWCSARAIRGLMFKLEHFTALSGKLLDHFCANPHTPFSFVRASQPYGLELSEFPAHLKELFSVLPSEVWIWHLACPLLASTIMLACYPPGAHRYPASMIYENLFRNPCKRVLAENVVQPVVRQGFQTALEKQLTALVENLPADAQESANAHLSHLQDLQLYLSQVKSDKTCLCCLMRAPEKVFTCGHSLCDNCVKVFGHQSQDSKYTFTISRCPLCGEINTKSAIYLLPPTAGIRLLSLDGGGVRGIVPLVVLQTIEEALVSLAAPLHQMFDFICGTSAGGLVAIGIFLMRWNARHGIRRFEDLAVRTFGQGAKSNFTVQKVHDLAVSYLRDGRYNSNIIEEAFRSAAGAEIEMFNPLTDDVKVAVTTTTAKHSKPCLFTNYNGGVRAPDSGYDIIRSSGERLGISTAEAASSTSAAPWFFKPKRIKDVGTFQDGGLHHNNPLSIALWELKHLWPDRPTPDFALSIGTGYSESLFAAAIGPQSPVKDRFISRIFKTFMKSLDGERMWREFHNSLPEKTKSKFHRFNIVIKGTEPAIDDVSSMERLKTQAKEHINVEKPLQSVLDSIYASMFFFELEDIPILEDGIYVCTGYVFCRLALSESGRRWLHGELIRTASYFIVLGQPIICVERQTKSCPLYRRRIKFGIGGMDDDIGITLRGITTQPTTISGMPKTARQLIGLQGLDVPFGRIDHKCREKSLPRTPSKRKYYNVS